MGKIRVLHMTPPEINNGVYQYLFNHMKYIDQDSCQFSFLTRNRTELMKTKAYEEYHFPIWSFENTQRDSSDGLRREIVRILGEGFDAIHLHTSLWRGFLIEEIAMEMGIPQVIVHSHSTGADFASVEEREKVLALHEAYKKQFTVEKATDFCACSRLAGEWLFGEQIPRERIRILPNAIETKRFHFQPAMRKDMRDKLRVQDRIVVGNVGRYSYQKNQEFLIRAFAKARRKNRQLFLLLIGQGELKNGLIRLIEELGMSEHAICLDWKENVEDYLQAMDVFCLPSRFEGLSICTAEAQASGLPCCVSDAVPEEARLTDLVEYLPLREEVWAQKLAGADICGDRKWMDDEIAAQGYEIRDAAKRLLEIYRGK